MQANKTWHLLCSANGLTRFAPCQRRLNTNPLPVSLLQSAFLLRDCVGWGIPKVVATVTKNPARVIGLNDRCELAPGLREDLICVRMSGDMPIVRGAWHKGERAF